jgi:hypothetical protein
MFALSRIAPKPLPLSPFERKLTANGLVEEGLFVHLLGLIEPKNRFCVEIGAGDGTNHSLTANLIAAHGYRALLLEADDRSAERLIAKYRGTSNVAKRCFVSPDNIVSVFREAGVPAEPALVCIDIDGNDYYVWQALAPHYRPDLVCIEYNPSFGPDREFVIPYKDDFVWSGDDFYGASFATLVGLGDRLGYQLIHCTAAGDNLVFARRELASRFPGASLPAREMYQIPQYGRNGRAPNGKGHPASTRTSTALERLWFRLRYGLMAIPRKVVYARHDPKGHRK